MKLEINVMRRGKRIEHEENKGHLDKTKGFRLQRETENTGKHE